jgi:uncharacterized protein YjeT (DUF2065 family)
MTWFYFGVALIFTTSGLIIIIKPELMKKMMQIIVQNDLFFIPGIIEIGIGLGTLYFRDQTRMDWFVFLCGLMFFLDGIFYMIMSKRLQELYEWFIGIADRTVRSYGLLMLLLALGYFLASLAR